ncbi:hypothetical protein CsatA_016235 [Cannabis sativa]
MVDYEIINHLCFFRNSPSWFILLVPLLLTFVGLVFGLKFFFSTLLIITSTIIYLFTLHIISKPKSVLVQSLVPSQEEDSVQVFEKNQDIITTSSSTTTIPPHTNSPNNDDSQSESEFLDYHSTTTDDSDEADYEHQWPYRNEKKNMEKLQWPRSTNNFSDDDDGGSISDEESLIEISLRSGHYVDHHQKSDNNNNIMSKDLFPDVVSSCNNIFRQRSLMELLAEINEMNEEENLIEIDISMGSIKCSRFEIQA